MQCPLSKANLLPLYMAINSNNDNFLCAKTGEQLDAHQCEALEEILKRVLFRLIDLDSCNLDCDVRFFGRQ